MTITHIKDLTHDSKNARAHTPRNIGMIERSLNEVGAGRSIVIDENNVVLAGNGLVEAAAQAGITRVRVVEEDGNTIIAVRRSNLSDEQKTKLALFDNRTAELAEWDASVLAELGEQGVDLSSMFFPEELNLILDRAGTELLIPDPQPQQEPHLGSECFVEIYCSQDDLDEFRATLDEWSARKSVTINIS